MRRPFLILLLTLTIFSGFELQGSVFYPNAGDPYIHNSKDTIDKQVLYIGRAWRVLYNNVKGDQFLFTKEFLNGSVTIGGKTYSNVLVKYDIYNDEILTTSDRGIILQLNKEMVEMFSMDFGNKTYKFRNLKADSLNFLSGYVNVLHEGKTSLFVKYKKDILLLAVEDKYDAFEQTYRVYLEKDGVRSSLFGKKDIINLLADKQKEVKAYIKKSKIKITKQNPESFIPVIIYYDSLRP